MKPLNIESLMDQEVQNLSGGELQRVAITMALGQPAEIYLIDEPSAYLDSEQRIIAAKVCVFLVVEVIYRVGWDVEFWGRGFHDSRYGVRKWCS